MPRLHFGMVRCCLLSFAMLLAGDRICPAQGPVADAGSPPTFKGRTFEEWKRLLPNDLDDETRADAYRALNAFSYRYPEDYLKPSIEIIKASLLKEPKHNVQLEGYRLHFKMSTAERKALFLAGLRSDHKSAAVTTLSGYHQMPTEDATEELADAVIEVLKTEHKEGKVNVRYNAILALGNIVRASEYEMHWDNSKSKKIRAEGEYGPISKKVLPLMEKLLNDHNSGVRSGSLNLVASFPADVAVPELARQLRTLVAAGNIDTNRRRTITEAEREAKEILRLLSYFGPKAQQALPTLKEILTDFPAVVPVLGPSIRTTMKAIEETDE